MRHINACSQTRVMHLVVSVHSNWSHRTDLRREQPFVWGRFAQHNSVRDSRAYLHTQTMNRAPKIEAPSVMTFACSYAQSLAFLFKHRNIFQPRNVASGFLDSSQCHRYFKQFIQYTLFCSSLFCSSYSLWATLVKLFSCPQTTEQTNSRVYFALLLGLFDILSFRF